MFEHKGSEQKQSGVENGDRQAFSNPTGMPDSMKNQYEAMSGLSLEDVRVHYHSGKPARLGAMAYAQGSHIYLGPGQERHLGHELGHVIQQKTRHVRPTGRLGSTDISISSFLEREADSYAQRAKSHENTRAYPWLRTSPPVSNTVVQLKPIVDEDRHWPFFVDDQHADKSKPRLLLTYFEEMDDFVAFQIRDHTNLIFWKKTEDWEKITGPHRKLPVEEGADEAADKETNPPAGPSGKTQSSQTIGGPDTYYTDISCTTPFDIEGFLKRQPLNAWLEEYREIGVALEQAMQETGQNPHLSDEAKAAQKERQRAALVNYVFQKYIVNALFRAEELQRMEYSGSPFSYQDRSTYMRSGAGSFANALKDALLKNNPGYTSKNVILTRSGEMRRDLDKFFLHISIGKAMPEGQKGNALLAAINSDALKKSAFNVALDKIAQFAGEAAAREAAARKAAAEATKTAAEAKAAGEAAVEAAKAATEAKARAAIAAATEKAIAEAEAAKAEEAAKAAEERAAKAAEVAKAAAERAAKAAEVAKAADDFSKYTELASNPVLFVDATDLWEAASGQGGSAAVSSPDAAGESSPAEKQQKLSEIQELTKEALLQGVASNSHISSEKVSVVLADQSKLSERSIGLVINLMVSEPDWAAFSNDFIREKIAFRDKMNQLLTAERGKISESEKLTEGKKKEKIIKKQTEKIAVYEQNIKNAEDLIHAISTAAGGAKALPPEWKKAIAPNYLKWKKENDPDMAMLYKISENVSSVAVVGGMIELANEGQPQSALLLENTKLDPHVKTAVNKAGFVPSITESIRSLLRYRDSDSGNGLSLNEMAKLVLEQQKGDWSKKGIKWEDFKPLLDASTPTQYQDADKKNALELAQVDFEIFCDALVRSKDNLPPEKKRASVQASAVQKLILNSNLFKNELIPTYVWYQLANFLKAATYSWKRLADFTRYIQSIHEIILLGLDLREDEPQKLDSQWEELSAGPFYRGFYLADYGLKAFAQVYDAATEQFKEDRGRAQADGAPMNIAAFYNIYFELTDKLRATRGVNNSEVKLSTPEDVDHYVTELKDPTFLPDIVMIDIHPNDASKPSIKANNVEQLLAGLAAKNVNEKKKKITVMVDITLNQAAEKEVRDLKKAAAPFISAGWLNLVFLQSLTKFAQMGMDKHSGGLIFSFNKPDEWKTYNTLLSEYVGKDPVDPSVQKYFSLLFSSIPQEQELYLKIIRENTRYVQRNLAAALAGTAITMTSNTDEKSCYVAWRYEKSYSQVTELYNAAMRRTPRIPDLPKDIYNLHQFNIAVLESGINKQLSRDKLPVAMRFSFGFPLSNLGETGNEVRFTIGMETPAELNAYINVISGIARKLQGLIDAASEEMKKWESAHSSTGSTGSSGGTVSAPAETISPILELLTLDKLAAYLSDPSKNYQPKPKINDTE